MKPSHQDDPHGIREPAGSTAVTRQKQHMSPLPLINDIGHIQGLRNRWVRI
jgi:hypothetical protein